MQRITTGIALAGCLLALSASAQTTPAAPQTAQEIPVLTVSGTGEARVAPDEATVRLGVFAQEPTARAAQDAVNRTANAILEAIRRLGVPADQIQTQDLSLNPVYAPQGRPEGENQEPRIAGYQATNTVAVRLDKLEQIGPVIDAGLAAGANRLDGVVFGLRNDEKAQAEALTRAVEAATAKAKTLARALRVRLVRVVDVAEGGIAVQPPPFLKGRFEADVAAMSTTPVSTGQVGVNASVTVRWEIAPE